MNKLRLIVALALFFSGCSADHYVRQADRQVQALIRDREKKTLDYTPQVEVPVAVVNTVPRRAYEKIPASPIPPKAAPPIEVERIEVPRAPLGPEASLFEAPVVEGQGWGEDLLERARQRTPLGPPAPHQVLRQFDLFACLQYAVQHSRAYQNRMEDLYLVALGVTTERHLFAPRPTAGIGLDYGGGQKASQYKSALTVITQAGVTQRLPYGGSIEARGLVNFVNAIHGNVEDGESAEVVLKGSLPLLRGFGMINLEPLISSERQLIYAVREFEDFRRTFVVDIAREYFRLLEAQQGIRNRRINLATSADLRERSQELYRAFRLSFLEVQRARQQELQAQNALITAEENYQSLLDSVKVTLGMPVEEALDVVPVEMDVNIPRITVEDAVALAHRYRLSLRTAADQVDDAMRVVKNSRNGLLPELNLTADARVTNEPDTPAVELQSRTATYNARLELVLPIDRLEERNRYRADLIRLQQAQRSLGGARDAVTADVRDALRRIAGAVVQLEIQRVAIELAERRVEFANIRLTQGAANSNRDVVEAQSSLLQAQDQFERAKSQLQITILDYLRVTGTLRVDPDAGTLGRVMDRAQAAANNSPQPR